MADTLYDVTSGFYDAINQDRLYSADQMNMPYKRLISEGVFATPAGTPSTDFQVVAVSGMDVKVKTGNAILGEKWVEMTSDQPVTISGNVTGNARVDSIILRVDRNSSARKASVIYRTGTPSSTPVAPDLVTSSNIYELRLANITVGSGATAITQSVIADQRGSADCPWVTSLIYQVDTSVLFDQWEDAYASQYQKQKDSWEQFYEQMSEDLTIRSSVIALTGTVTTTESTAAISLAEFGIENYDPATDELMIFINGLYAIEGDKWSMVLTLPDTYEVTFDTALSAGQSVYAVCLHAIATGAAQSLYTEIQSLKAAVGSPLVASTAAAMTDHDKIYVYTGSETGYTAGNWYYWNGSAWTSGGVYNAVAVNTITDAQIDALFE